MNYKIAEVEGIGPAYAEKLSAAGIKTTGGLLKACATPAGRKKVAETTGISPKLILKWTNRADVMRLKGIGKQFAELREASVVDTVKELRNRSAANLAVKMKEVNTAKKLSRSTPSESMVAGWVAQAKEAEPAISY